MAQSIDLPRPLIRRRTASRRLGKRAHFDWSALLQFTLLLVLYSLLVYSVPYYLQASTENSFDAFSYAASMTDNAAEARELQPFLQAYPSAWAPSMLPAFSVALHLILLAPALWAVQKLPISTPGLKSILSALSSPEAVLFLAGVTKEGLAIVALVHVLLATLFAQRSAHHWALFFTVTGIALAEFSRPGMGALVMIALISGYALQMRGLSRSVIATFSMACTAIGVWAILYGPWKEDFLQIYEAAKLFLDWFEENMGSDSAVKSAVRGGFALIFSSDQPDLQFLATAAVASLLKALVYVLAMPVISPTQLSEIPAQIWAATWQISTTLSSLLLLTAAVRFFRAKRSTAHDIPRLLPSLGLILLLLIAVSTAIFHVRYRAPAMFFLLCVMTLMGHIRRRELKSISLIALIYGQAQYLFLH